MSIADYRRQIEAEIARERERAAQPVLDAAAGDVEALGALAASGIPHQSDVERAQAALDAPDALPELRAAALRIVTDAHPDPATAHEAALQRVTDASQPPEVRMAALQVLKVQAIASPSFPEWRPDYLQAMRTASRDEVPAIRRAALEVLATYKDPYAAEVLLAGLREPARALVLPEEALQLLGLRHTRGGVRDRRADRRRPAEPPGPPRGAAPPRHQRRIRRPVRGAVRRRRRGAEGAAAGGDRAERDRPGPAQVGRRGVVPRHRR